MTDDPAIRRMMTHLSPAWHGEFREKVARHLVETNRAYGMALDARPDSLDADINAFFTPSARGDNMPMQTSASAAMPAGLNDNYTGSSGGHRIVGGMNYHRRNGNASDQRTSAEGFLNAYSALPEEVQLQIFQALASNYGVDLEGEAAAEDQGSPMQFSNGSGTAPADLLEAQTGEGTFSERDPTGTGPRGTADARPRTMRDRRHQAHDRMAQDSIDQRYRNQQSFDQRWGGLTGHVSIWGGGGA